jgi:hypothetical protein
MSPDRNRKAETSAALLRRLAPSRPFSAVLTDAGAEVVPLVDVFDETIVNCFWREVLVYLVTGDRTALTEFAGVRVAGRELVSDASLVGDWFHCRGRFAR